MGRHGEELRVLDILFQALLDGLSHKFVFAAVSDHA